MLGRSSDIRKLIWRSKKSTALPCFYGKRTSTSPDLLYATYLADKTSPEVDFNVNLWKLKKNVDRTINVDKLYDTCIFESEVRIQRYRINQWGIGTRHLEAPRTRVLSSNIGLYPAAKRVHYGGGLTPN
ncbi:hypothetical protein DP116_06540 [Brasilonema bromeliae SPC951]|uniref:Uncharacterized protein n=1 Tax=Brasilonema bromeliae SPC951 TaxID=385972 RepID=A0ABX1P474_9CYAN|nr:hypothetical protein [Brasilonema bromeliae SPC951]